MKDIILAMTDILNNVHDLIQLYVRNYLHWDLTDKDLHFWIMGIIGIIVFLFVLVVSKLISKMRFGITILSFFYTFTFMVVLVFAIEIQQAITDRGHMEFQDAVVGLWGFIAFFLVFVVVALLFMMVKKLMKKFTRASNKKLNV